MPVTVGLPSRPLLPAQAPVQDLVWRLDFLSLFEEFIHMVGLPHKGLYCSAQLCDLQFLKTRRACDFILVLGP